MPAARPQNLRVLEGRFVLARVTDMGTVAFDADLLALVLGPDGRAAMRRDDTAEDAWVALWNGDDAPSPSPTRRACSVPLWHRSPAGELPVWTAASYDGDLVLDPGRSRLEEAVDVLRRARSPRVTVMSSRGSIAFALSLLAAASTAHADVPQRSAGVPGPRTLTTSNGYTAALRGAPLSSRVANAETVRGEAATGRSASMSRSSDRLRSPGEGPRQARPTTPGDPI